MKLNRNLLRAILRLVPFPRLPVLPVCRRRRIHDRIRQPVAREPALPPTLKLRRHPSAPVPPRALSRPSSKCHRSAKRPAAPLAPDRKLKTRRAILPPLPRCQSRLALRCPQPHQCARRQSQPPFGMRLAQHAQRFRRQHSRLVESALRILRPVQRHWNHQHLRRSLTRELRNRLGQHPPQPARRRVQPVVFERVDRLPHSPLVQTKRRRPPERWRRLPAGAAEICMKRPTGAMQRVAATSADTTTLDRKFSPAGIANWNGSKPRQRRAA